MSIHELDTRTWPRTGRIGYCHAGDMAGRYVFLHLATEDRDPQTAYWQAFFEPSPDEFGGEVFVDNRSGTMQKMLDDFKVDWAPDDLDLEIEDQIMGLRRRFALAGSPFYSTAVPGLRGDRGSSSGSASVWP